jgi:hypothetical protein
MRHADRVLPGVTRPRGSAPDTGEAPAGPAGGAATGSATDHGPTFGQVALRGTGIRIAGLYALTVIAQDLAGHAAGRLGAALLAAAVTAVTGTAVCWVCARPARAVPVAGVVALTVVALTATGLSGLFADWHRSQMTMSELAAGTAAGLTLAVGAGWGTGALGFCVLTWITVSAVAHQPLDPVQLLGATVTAAVCVSVRIPMARGFRHTEAALRAAQDALRASNLAAARWRARRQENRMLHDTVLSTLTVLAHGGAGLTADSVRDLCARDLRALRDPGDDPLAPADRPPSDPADLDLPRPREVQDEPRAADPPAGGADPFGGLARRWQPRGLELRVHGEADSQRLRDLPAPATEALLAAVEACVSNIWAHADVTCADIAVSRHAGQIRCVVLDEGLGFDPGTVPGDRLGIRQSIHGRMRAVGGSATVWSAPGQGTSVLLAVPL